MVGIGALSHIWASCYNHVMKSDVQKWANTLSEAFATKTLQLLPKPASKSKYFAKYDGNPIGYAHDVLKIGFIWDKMADAIRSIHETPYKTLIRSGHGPGKTFLLGLLVNYWFDVYDPSVCIVTGPSYESLCDTVWSEVRLQRARAGLPDDFIGPTSPEMATSPDHWAKALSTRSNEAFQGKHRSRMLFIFEEAVELERIYWTMVRGMFQPGAGHAWVCVCNPTDVGSQFYQEEQSNLASKRPKWHVFSFASTEHPNVQLGIANRADQVKAVKAETGTLPADFRTDPIPVERLPVPNAVNIEQIDDWVEEYCLPIDESEKTATDIAYLHDDGIVRYWRPQMDWEARCGGCWPSSPTASIWSDYLFKICQKGFAKIPLHLEPQIGVDVARMGDDKTAIFARWGPVAISHETFGKQPTTYTTGRVVERCRVLAQYANELRGIEGNRRGAVDPLRIAVKVDDDGIGGAVTDMLLEQGYNVTPIRAGFRTSDPTRYTNVRSELWFQTASRAVHGEVVFQTLLGHDPNGQPITKQNLDAQSLQLLSSQAVAPLWKLARNGAREVEEKRKTKQRLGRSPDDMDAMNLAYYEAGWQAPEFVDSPIFERESRAPMDRQPLFQRHKKTRLFGR
jgi:hypothetical protein